VRTQNPPNFLAEGVGVNFLFKKRGGSPILIGGDGATKNFGISAKKVALSWEKKFVKGLPTPNPRGFRGFYLKGGAAQIIKFSEEEIFGDGGNFPFTPFRVTPHLKGL